MQTSTDGPFNLDLAFTLYTFLCTGKGRGSTVNLEMAKKFACEIKRTVEQQQSSGSRVSES